MPPKRSHLQSPNPVKFQLLEEDLPTSADIQDVVTSPPLAMSPAHLETPPRAALDEVSMNIRVTIADTVTIEAPPSSPPHAVPANIPVTPPRSGADADAMPPSSPSTNRFPPASPPLAVPANVPVTPTRSGAVANAMPPPSPATNRSRFLNGCQPVRVCCNLDLMRWDAVKFGFCCFVGEYYFLGQLLAPRSASLPSAPLCSLPAAIQIAVTSNSQTNTVPPASLFGIPTSACSELLLWANW